MMVESVNGTALSLCPDQGFVGICKPYTPKIGHRIGLDPNNIIENPILQVLEYFTDLENVVIGTNHPQGARPF
jgi:hypothetical protein